MTRVKKATAERTDREKLELFLRRYQDLAKRNLARKGIHIKLEFYIGDPSELDMTLTEPEEEEVRSLLVTFRQFISEDEPVFLSRIYNICSKRLVDDKLKELVANSRKNWVQAKEVSKIKLLTGADEGAMFEVWKIWIDGWYFHNDVRYQRILDQCLPEGLKILRFIFLTFIGCTGECIAWLNRFIIKALDKNKFDFEL